MTYYVSKVLDLPFEKAVARVEEELKREGFGVLTEIDVKKTLKEKLGVDFKRYLILGACNPELAHRALQAEDKIGLMLPCNVVVEEDGAGGIEVAAVDPVASMLAVENEALREIGREVRARLKTVISRI